MRRAQTTRTFRSAPLPFLCLLGAVLCVPFQSASATTYLIETQTQFDGITALTVHPGDSILLKRGETFTGQLTLSARGSTEQPIVLSAYGAGDRPHIEGNGVSNYEGVIHLVNCSDIELSALSISNVFGTKTKSYGILANHSSGIEATNVRILDNHVHHITSDDNDRTAGSNDKTLGGIHLVCSNGSSFRNVLIADNVVEYAGRSGISTQSNSTPYDDLEDTTGMFYELVIRSNTVSYASGDGIVMRDALRGLAEHNVVHHCGYTENALPTSVSAGLWGGWKNIDCVYQFNEVYAHYFNADASGFDFDGHSLRTIVQYNYSHDNAGGFIMAWGPIYECVARYNISVNETFFGRSGNWPSWGQVTCYNNTHIRTDGNSDAVTLQAAVMHNNIFYLPQSSLSFGSSVNTHSNNAFTASSPPSETGAIINGDLRLNLPSGDAPIGIDNIGSYYQIANGSEAVDAGFALTDPGEQDFFGGLLSGQTLDMGAHELDATATAMASDRRRLLSHTLATHNDAATGQHLFMLNGRSTGRPQSSMIAVRQRKMDRAARLELQLNPTK